MKKVFTWKWGKVNAEFEWLEKPDDIAKRIISSDAQLFLANEAKKLMDPYVPARNLVLAQNVSIYVEKGHGIVEYLSPHAHYQFMGELYVSSVTGSPFASKGEHKVPTGIPLEQDGFRHPDATSHWDDAMKVARMDDLTQACQRFIDRGAK